jgi:hypothetical protein
MIDKYFLVPVLTFLTLFAVIMLVRFFPDISSFSACEPTRCTLQDWMAATSGWVGFGAAAIGAYFVYHQLAEQRKQTAFVLGDGQPTFEMIRRSQRPHSAALRLTNWNRRTLVIASLQIMASASFVKPIGIRRMASSEPEKISAADFILFDSDGAIAMPRASGWLDRQKSPTSVTFVLLFEGRLLGPQQAVAPDVPATIELEVFFSGETKRPFKIRAEGLLSDFLPCDVPRGGFYLLPEKKKAGLTLRYRHSFTHFLLTRVASKTS